MGKRKEVCLKSDITIAFSPDRLITIGIPVEMEEILGLQDGDWIVVRKLSSSEVEERGLERAYKLKQLISDRED